MLKVGEDEEKTIEEASNAVEETRTHEEDERIRVTISELDDPEIPIEEGSMDPSNSNTVTSEDPDFNESDMEDEKKVLEYFRRSSGLILEVGQRNNFPYLNKSEQTVLPFQEDIPAETEQSNVVHHTANDSNETAGLEAGNLNSPGVLEGIKSSSASDEDTEDSSSNSDFDYSSLSRYYFDGSIPVSARVKESETHQDESPGPNDENQTPLLCPNQAMQQSTSWRNCCGLLELLRSADP